VGTRPASRVQVSPRAFFIHRASKMQKEIAIKTTKHDEFLDITPRINRIVKDSGIKEGICIAFCPHTTAAITINENADPDVIKDILTSLDKKIPWEDEYRHSEGNSAAHIKSSLVGCSESMIIEEGKLLLGTWQSVFFCEFDGPRTRKVIVKLSDSEK